MSEKYLPKPVKYMHEVSKKKKKKRKDHNKRIFN